MGKIRILVVFGLIAGLSGCSLRSMMDHIAPETVSAAKTNFDFLRHGQFDRIVPSLDPSIDRDGLTDKLAAMAALIPTQDPVSIETVGAFAECDTRKGCDTRVTLEYEFPSKWLLVELVVHSGNGKSAITNFHVQGLSESLEQTNRFTFRGKGAVQYVMLFAALITAGLTICAFVLCIRTPMVRRKWLWIIFILIGIGRVGMNWTTGELFHNIAWFNLLPVGTYGQPYGPWTITVSIPIGAIVFLFLRDGLRKPIAPAPGLDEAPPSLTSA
jgi:hypothetical protein